MNLQKLYDLRQSSDWAVWRGENAATRQRFTVKESAPESPYRPQLMRRLDQECRFLQRLHHPHILRVQSVDAGNCRAVFEDVQCNLTQYLRSHGPLAPAQVGQVMLQVAEALEALHRDKTGHGCINTNTILLGPAGDTRLGDFLGYEFGTGKLIPAPDPELTYQAPEVIDSSLGKIGPSADLYCLGFAAIEMLIGDRFRTLFDLPSGASWLAWHADTTKTLAHWRSSLSHIPAGLLDLIAGLIAKPIAERAFSSASQFLAALRRSRLASSQALPFYKPALATSAMPDEASTPRSRARRTSRRPLRRPRLVLLPLDGRTGIRSFRPSHAVMVGRSAACQLAIPAPTVSTKHALLACSTDGVWRAFDLGSSSGTLVNGAPQNKSRLQSGQVLSFGGVDYRVKVGEASELGHIHQFELRELIHQGAQGKLYRADWAERDGRSVAVRVFEPEFATDEFALRRFLRGVPCAARFRHPNLARMYRAGISRHCSDRVWYLAMEYFPGRSLRDRLRSRGRLRWQEVIRLAKEIGSGLAALSTNGWVHRNINPASVLFAVDGTAKLGDFAFYRSGTVDSARAVTVADRQIEHVCYQSPEFIKNVPDLTQAADWYSLGATLFEALTGRPPFDPAQAYPDLCRAICEETPPNPRDLVSDVPDHVNRLVGRLMAREPIHRINSVQQFLSEARDDRL